MEYSEKECLDVLREAANEVEGVLTSTDYREMSFSPSVKTLEKKFGSWVDAKKEAGIQYWEHGKNPTPDDVRKYHSKNKSWDHVPIYTRETGHEVWKHSYMGDTETVPVHRLMIVAEKGLDAIDGKDVHHKNEIPWDNRSENLMTLTRSAHMSYHSST